jgi:hypothetical protein
MTLANVLQWEYRVLQHQQTRNLAQRSRVIDYLADATRFPSQTPDTKEKHLFRSSGL